MTNLGRISDARRALNGELRAVGQGGSRMVFVDDRERFVYKVEIYPGLHNDNEMEHKNATFLREKGVKFVPPTRLIKLTSRSMVEVYDYDLGTFVKRDEVVEHTVLVMPFYPLDPSLAADHLYDRWWKYIERHVDDMFNGNWRLTRDGRPRVTDVQYLSTVWEKKADKHYSRVAA